MTTQITTPPDAGAAREPEWTHDDQAAAEREGWALFNLGTPRLELQRDDDRDVFADDNEAWAHVVARYFADEGDRGLHARALRYLARYAPCEYDAIRDYMIDRAREDGRITAAPPPAEELLLLLAAGRDDETSDVAPERRAPLVLDAETVVRAAREQSRAEAGLRPLTEVFAGDRIEGGFPRIGVIARRHAHHGGEVDVLIVPIEVYAIDLPWSEALDPNRFRVHTHVAMASSPPGTGRPLESVQIAVADTPAGADDHGPAGAWILLDVRQSVMDDDDGTGTTITARYAVAVSELVHMVMHAHHGEQCGDAGDDGTRPGLRSAPPLTVVDGGLA